MATTVRLRVKLIVRSELEGKPLEILYTINRDVIIP